jgi:hypothetical protein
LWAIIGLNSMPAMQYGQRMVKVVSVANGRSFITSKGGWHAGFQTPRRVIPLKDKRSWGAIQVSSPNPHRDFGRRDDGPADHAGNRNTQPNSAPGEKRKRPRLRLESWGAIDEQPSPENCSIPT